VYCRLGLNRPRRTERKLPKPEPRSLEFKPAVNDQWALDFIHYTLFCGKRYTWMNPLGAGTRKCLAIKVDISQPAARVVRVLEQLREERGLPEQIRPDNRPELVADAFAAWSDDNVLDLAYIEQGKLQQIGSAERFNGSMRRELLDAYLETIRQVREMAWQWRLD